MSTLADLHYRAGQYEQAEELYRKIISKRYELEGAIAADSGWSYSHNLAGVLVKQKKYAEAESITRELIPMYASRFGPEEGSQEAKIQAYPQQEISVILLLAQALEGQGKHEEARANAESALARAEKMTEPEKTEQAAKVKEFLAAIDIDTTKSK
jgi:tetratricopeptide (TPR) repeat protein